MRWTLSCLMVCGLLGACASTPTSPVAEPQPTSPAGDCPTEKLAFTQATGCRSDGSLEFCVPKGDPQLLERLRAAVPELRAAGGGRGRAGCDLTREALYFLDTRPEQECVSGTAALTDAAWRKVCRIALEPAIARIVPTWYE
ncbi:hypothetical protein [Hyalangium gracile]|uniref:hypothetical protein n=1 Tax=Hyalangium gracile TaxID=394092 RepID=UPI001CCF97A6|nr:hypothetical protein [Hyalangium gracile]